MGAAGSIECLKSNGESFIFFYIDEETNWQKTKECFDGINGCKFNGPHPKTFYKESLLSLGGNDEIVTKSNLDGKRLRLMQEIILFVKKNIHEDSLNFLVV